MMDVTVQDTAAPAEPEERALERAAGAWTTARVAAAASGAFDRCAAMLLLLILSPLILAIAIAVRLDSPGSPIFRQRRVGRGQREFTVLKFRTMSAQAAPDRHQDYVSALIAGTSGEPQAGGLYKLTADDRVTRVGRVLRTTSLDEVPQLWNVVRGEMSLVGPRPVIPYEVERYPVEWLERFAVKPGLTGLWQVSGRNERTYEEMVQFDREYVHRASFRLDVKILFQTVTTVVTRRGVA